MNNYKIENNEIVSNYTKEVIKSFAIIYDKRTSVLKHGENKDDRLSNYYWKMKKSYITVGYKELAEDLIFRDMNICRKYLTIKHFCILINYITQLAGAPNKIHEILNMKIKDLKIKLEELEKFGYL